MNYFPNVSKKEEEAESSGIFSGNAVSERENFHFDSRTVADLLDIASKFGISEIIKVSELSVSAWVYRGAGIQIRAFFDGCWQISVGVSAQAAEIFERRIRQIGFFDVPNYGNVTFSVQEGLGVEQVLIAINQIDLMAILDGKMRNKVRFPTREIAGRPDRRRYVDIFRKINFDFPGSRKFASLIAFQPEEICA